MDDRKILDLYFKRSEDAIRETSEKYGRLLFGIAYGILDSRGDSEECLDDTYMRAWESIPPTRPSYFGAFLAKITRNIALNRLRARRRCANVELILDELEECIPDGCGNIADGIAMRELLNRFISSEGGVQREIFIRRYFYMQKTRAIAEGMGLSHTNVKVILSRTRSRLREFLERAGISI